MKQIIETMLFMLGVNIVLFSVVAIFVERGDPAQVINFDQQGPPHYCDPEFFGDWPKKSTCH